MEGSPKKPNRSKSILALALLAAALVLAAAALRLFTVRVGGRLYLCADTADARAAAISCEDYDAAVARRPQAVIRWSVPIGRERFDSFSETITLSALPEDEIGRLGARTARRLPRPRRNGRTCSSSGRSRARPAPWTATP